MLRQTRWQKDRQIDLHSVLLYLIGKSLVFEHVFETGIDFDFFLIFLLSSEARIFGDMFEAGIATDVVVGTHDDDIVDHDE